MSQPSRVAAATYYDRFSVVYDWISAEAYYKRPREYAIGQLDLKADQRVLNIPCGTGQNFGYFADLLAGTGQVVGIDLSAGMLAKAQRKIDRHRWRGIDLVQADATSITTEWVDQHLEPGLLFDAILCDLGLSGFPEWQTIIDNLISLLAPGGRLVIMDWYIDKPSARGRFISWIGKGDVDRPLYQYLADRMGNVEVNTTFKSGQMFVAAGRALPAAR